MKFAMPALAAAALFALVLHAKSDKQVQPRKAQPKVASEVKAPAVSAPERAPLAGSRQGYKMVIDILDGFGGASESANYRIPVSSGGQPSAGGISHSDSFVMKAGFVHASYIMRGDANADGVIDVGDVVCLLNYLFKGGAEPCPMEAGDTNCDGVVDLGDIVYLLNYLFRGGPSPAC